MKRIQYWLSAKFSGQPDGAQVAAALSAMSENVVLYPRSKRVVLSEGALREAISGFSERDGLEISFQLERGGCRARGRLWLPPLMAFAGRSTFEVDFSLPVAGFDGLFPKPEVMRAAAATVCRKLAAPIVQVEARDLSSELQVERYERFQRIDSDAVPSRLEWITALSAVVAERLGWTQKLGELRRNGLIAEQEDGVWVLMLVDRPFSYATGVGIEEQLKAERLLGLADAQRRFPRRNGAVPPRPQ